MGIDELWGAIGTKGASLLDTVNATDPVMRSAPLSHAHAPRFVLYKEKNMLLTEALHCKRGQQRMPQSDRRLKVRF